MWPSTVVDHHWANTLVSQSSERKYESQNAIYSLTTPTTSQAATKTPGPEICPPTLLIWGPVPPSRDASPFAKAEVSILLAESDAAC